MLLLQLHVAALFGRVDPLIVVVDGNGERALGLILANHVFVEHRLDFGRLGQILRFLARRSPQIIGDDLLAQRDALIADIHAVARNDAANLILRFVAEGAARHARLPGFVLISRHFAPQKTLISLGIKANSPLPWREGRTLSLTFCAAGRFRR